jgi:hypothetical protein
MNKLSLLLVTLTACASPAPPAPSEPARAPATSARKPEAPPVAPKARTDGEPCGELGCLAFDGVDQAFAKVLETEPRVLALGEAHAQKGSEGIDSSTRRFTELLLPKLQGRASDLVVEIWLTDGSCGKKEAEVAQKQKPVTESQAATNQNEFVTLAQRAKALSIQPHALRPSCDEYEKILAAQNDIGQMLTMIADATAKLVERMLAERPADRMVVAYGGAMHNDLQPREGRDGWSFGPRLAGHTNGRYVELDLIVPEFIKETEVWRALPWYAHYDREKLGNRTVLFNPSPGSYVLIFPVSR